MESRRPNYTSKKAERLESRLSRKQKEGISLTAQESENFVNAMMNPPTPNLALQKSAKRHRDFFSQDN